MSKKKQYDDDDGRTIVDMSGVESPSSLFLPRIPRKEETPSQTDENSSQERPWEKTELSKQERRTVVLGAMSASALIAGIFIAAAAIAIAVMLFIMNR